MDEQVNGGLLLAIGRVGRRIGYGLVHRRGEPYDSGARTRTSRGGDEMELAPTEAGFEPNGSSASPTTSIRNYIDSGKIVGCQVLVARHGHVAYFKSLGPMDRERDKPMRDDTIFRIYSMSKPITSVALMSLYEQGHSSSTTRCSRSSRSGGTARLGLRRRRLDGDARA